MAELLQCDGCGAISPDPETGLHVANKWNKINILRKCYYVDDSVTLNLCLTCLPKPENHYDEQGWAKSAINFFRGRK